MSTTATAIDWDAFEEANPIIVPSKLESPHLITRRTAAVCGWEINPPWKGEKPAWRDCFDISLRNCNRQRVALLIDTLAKACDVRGIEMRHDPKGSHHGISFFVGNEPIPLRLIELGDMVTYLSLETGKGYGRKKWKDSPRRPLEKRLNEVVRYLRGHAAANLARRLAWSESERKEAEFMRRRAELRKEIRREQKAVDGLIAEARAWRQAKEVRAYVAAVKVIAKQDGTLGDHAEWIDWALDQADRLDPLCISPASVLDTPRDQYRELDMHECLNEDGEIEHI